MRIFCKRANAVAIGMGSSSGCSPSVSPSTSSCSLAPRFGSRSSPTTTARTSARIAVAKNAHRQPSSPPASAAIPPTVTGASTRPTGLARLSRPKILPRACNGYASASRELCTGNEFDCASPLATRATNNHTALVTRPVANTTTDHAAVANDATLVRGARSARAPNGKAPRTKRTPNAPPMTPITASLTPRLDWMSGASTASAVRSSHSTTTMSDSTTSVATPPHRTAARSATGSSPTPGSRSSGSTVPIGRGRGSLPRRLLLQEDGREGRRIPVLVVGSHGHQWSDQ